MENKIIDSELRALLSIRNFTKALENHHSQMRQIEKNLREMNKNSLAIIEAKSTQEQLKKWKTFLKQSNMALSCVNEVLTAAKEKMVKKDRSDSSGLWKFYDSNLENLKEANKNLKYFGLSILPNSEHLHWKKDVCNFENAVLPLIFSHAEACKMELQLIEKYTPKQLHRVTQIILDHIPEDFDFEQADKYEKDYLKAFEDFKKEFSKEKTLWDKFLDVLAAGTHQPPSERVMMKRWLEGEKHDL